MVMISRMVRMMLILWMAWTTCHATNRVGYAVQLKPSGGTSCAMDTVPIQESLQRNTLACTAQCLGKPSCVGFNWMEATGLCKLLDDGNTNNLKNVPGRR